MIKKVFMSIILIVVTNCIQSSTLSEGINKLQIDTILVTTSQAIDESPMWSSDSNSIAANIEGTWYKFNLVNIKLQEGKWHQNKIGILQNAKTSILKETEREQFKRNTNYDKKIITNSGIIIELKANNDFSTSLIITKTLTTPKILWKTGLENCHSLSLSPNQEYVAYICELSGLFIMKLN